jgi:uncharacterized protein
MLRYYRFWGIFSLTTVLVMITGCHPSDQVPDRYAQEIASERQQHLEHLKSDDGWLNLAGLYWLKEGKNTFGSDSSNRIVFPGKAPSFMGYFTFHDGRVTVHVAPKVTVTLNGKAVHDTVMVPDTDSTTTTLKNGSLVWYAIKRGPLTGIRLRDLDSPNIHLVDSIPGYPADTSWRITARFIPFTAPMNVEIPTIVGTPQEGTSPGILYFKYEGKQYSLQPLGTPDNLFVVFADQTSGKETYGSGRFLSIEGPVADGKYIIDFNKAYNPPCAFTPYATCPIPMATNILPFAVTAGEKTDPGWHGHQ